VREQAIELAQDLEVVLTDLWGWLDWHQLIRPELGPAAPARHELE